MTQQEIINSLQDWLKKQCRSQGRKGFLINANDVTLPVALAGFLCHGTGRDVFALQLDDDLTGAEEAEYSFSYRQCGSGWQCPFTVAAETALIANRDNLLVVAPFNQVELEFTRPWDRFCFVADVLPFGNMSRVEIEELYAFATDLTPEYVNIYRERPQEDQSPFDDIVKVTYKELDWAWYQNVHQNEFKGILNCDDPSKHKYWWGLTTRQKQIISFLHQRIQLTQHKVVLKPRF